MSGPTSFLSVVFPGKVTIVPEGSSLALGPDLLVRCRDLEMRGDTVQILRRAQTVPDGSSTEASVVFEVSGRFRCDSTLTGSPSDDVLELLVTPTQRLVYPWIAYRHELESPPSQTDERATRFLNMLMNLVSKHGRKQWAVFDKKLEGRQSIKGDDFASVLARLQAMGVIHVEGAMVFLDDRRAEERFDGKGRPGQPSLEDRIDAWRPVLDEISATLG